MPRSAIEIDAAVEAAAQVFHDLCRERWQPRWENASIRWRDQMKAFVRPLVVAGLEAADSQKGTIQHPTSVLPADSR